MAEIDPELRDIIVKTHTIVGRMDEEFKEHKRATHARLRDIRSDFIKHKDETEQQFKVHSKDIQDGKTFRTKVITYASVIAGAIAFFSDPVIKFVKMFFQA
jgi:hypothetical protein